MIRYDMKHDVHDGICIHMPVSAHHALTHSFVFLRATCMSIMRLVLTAVASSSPPHARSMLGVRVLQQAQRLAPRAAPALLAARCMHACVDS